MDGQMANIILLNKHYMQTIKLTDQLIFKTTKKFFLPENLVIRLTKLPKVEIQTSETLVWRTTNK